MSKNRWSLVAGLLMTAAGAVLYFAFAEVETPVIGLRQLGAVLAVLGVIEVVVTTFALRRSSTQRQ